MTQPTSSHPGTLIDLWYTRCGAATASALAIQKNWLQAEFSQGGTKLHSLRESNDIDILNSHYHHKLTGLFREGGNIPPIWAKAQGQNTAVIGITWLDEYQGILTLADSGIREVKDLRGKRLGLPLHRNLIDFQRGAAQHAFVTAYGLAGLNPKDAIFVDLESPHQGERQTRAGQAADWSRSFEVDALLEGKVDAIFLRFTRGYRVAQDPRFHEVINLNTLADPLLRVGNGTPRPVTVDRPFLEQHPDLVVRYLAVLLRTAAWAENHPRESAEQLIPDNGGFTVEDVWASHGRNVHRSFTPKLSPDYIKGLETQKNFLRDWGYLHADFEFSDWIVTEPLAEAIKLVEREPGLVEFPASLAA
jgi:ABC-type nitrate/sulfonate/bicarbonate transport system substrate-binding protein